MSILSSLKSHYLNWRDSQIEPPPFGVYHFQRQEGADKVRMHLRIDPDGKGLLLVNASRAYHLNPTAAFMAFLILKSVPEQSVLKLLQNKYSVPVQVAKVDYQQLKSDLDTLILPGSICPIHDLELETTAPFSQRPSAPYRMDLAITYRCNNACAHCYNARARNYPELSTQQWLKILDKLWDVGIPHIVFTGGEPTLRSDLPELIAHAEKNGQITGINTNGRRLKDQVFLDKLVQSGLDHIQITLESHLAAIHDEMVMHPGAWEETTAGLKNALKTHLYVMTNTTLLQNNSPYLAGTLQYLADLRVPTLGLNALIHSGHGSSVGTGLAEADLPPLLELARSSTKMHGQRLIWYTPTQYCHFDPMMLELGVKGCSAALYNMCVEPDGAVIPCQSYYHSLGNVMNTPWDKIWNHDLAISLRERKNLPAACNQCSLLSECGGGCPLSRQQPLEIPIGGILS